ncbi:hypothetical protein B296_00030831 [Ensete ventricosum]|uniref:Uncharacterized protein n=1 Tax=Ensete ventricosum TaxID=4639 RepID=A0A426ZIG8_ENSVE|nr:hypothetical protein B296_00030831 [Ensete ventricosum]
MSRRLGERDERREERSEHRLSRRRRRGPSDAQDSHCHVFASDQLGAGQAGRRRQNEVDVDINNLLLLTWNCRIIARKPKDVWAVRLAIGTYLIDGKYFKPLDVDE